jgi:hypothetical protein
MGTYKDDTRGVRMTREAERDSSLIEEEAKEGNSLLLQV